MREHFNESQKKKKSFLPTFRAEAYATLAWDQAPHWGKRRKNLAWAAIEGGGKRGSGGGGGLETRL